MPSVLAMIADERIRQAQARGEFDDLPGQGRPLVFDEDPLAPEELRVAWRLLRGAGLVGPGADRDVPMPSTFAAMMALVDRRRDRPDPAAPAQAGRTWLLAEARRRRWRRDGENPR